MSDDLIISGGDSTVVASDAILHRIDSLDRLAQQLFDMVSALDLLEQESLSLGLRAAGLESDSAAATLAQSRERLAAARATAAATAHRSTALGERLRRALAAYGASEEQAVQRARTANANEAWWLGRVAGTFALPLAIGVGVDELILSAMGITPARQKQATERYLLAHPGLVTGRGVVDSVRDVTDGADDFDSGVIGLPPDILKQLEQVAGGGGTALGARVTIAIANQFGLLGETGVKTRLAGSASGAGAPTTMRDRFDRIPHAADEPQGQQIRIDRYRTAGRPDRFDVYVGGTADFGLRAGSQPFDMTSNVAGVAGTSPASYRAVLSAMHQAGVTSRTPVQVTGYSQGGLIASLVAANPKFDVKGLVTFGAPSGDVPVPAHVPTLTVRNVEDLVPATGGYDLGNHAVVIERAVFDDRPIPAGIPVPAHQPQYYQRTATIIDAASSSEVTSLRSAIDSFGAGTDSTHITTWVAERTP